MTGSSNDADAITDINVTPLVDIILVVLIIFMATAPLIHRRALNVDVPVAAHQEKAKRQAIEIAYDKARALFLDGRKVKRSELELALTALRQSDPDIRVLVSGDRSLSYGEIIALLDLVRGAGLRKVSLEVKAR